MNQMENKINGLLKTAVQLGASHARCILSSDIITRKSLAALCNGETKCENYGLGMGCPPNVGGPAQFETWKKQSDHSIVVKIDLPTQIMFSAERRDIYLLLHEIVATTEREAIELGFIHAKSFAGGSCKRLFCEDQSYCNVIETQKECRFPQIARPSMSGFGIDVGQMMKSAGWSVNNALPQKSDPKNSFTWIAGLILL